MRALVLLFLLTPLTAQAQAFVCPFVTIGWAKQWSGKQISSASYDSALQLLYVVFPTATVDGKPVSNYVSAFSGVPTSVMTGFSSTPDPMSYYLSAVQPRYHSLLLAQSNNCPVLYETGAYLWTK